MLLAKKKYCLHMYKVKAQHFEVFFIIYGWLVLIPWILSVIYFCWKQWMLFPIPKFSPAVALVLELRYLTGQTCDNLWPFGKKKEFVFNSSSSSKTTICWSVGNPSISICIVVLLSTMVHQYMYCLVRKQLRKINVMRILQNSSIYGYIICIVSKWDS